MPKVFKVRSQIKKKHTSLQVYTCNHTSQTQQDRVARAHFYSHMPLGAPGWRGGIMGGMPPGGGPAEGGPGSIRPGIGWPGPIGPAVKRLQGEQIRPLFGRDDVGEE